MTPSELKTDVEQAPKTSCLLYQQRIMENYKLKHVQKEVYLQV